MPTLWCINACRVDPEPAAEVLVVLVENHRLRSGRVARLGLRDGRLTREYLPRAKGAWREGEPVNTYAVSPGIFEATSTRRVVDVERLACRTKSKPFTVYFGVRDGDIELIGQDGAERAVMDRLRAEATNLQP